MKRILFLFNVLACSTLFAQEGSVGIGTQTPNEKAVLHLVAPNNDQGFLVPKLTSAQRNTFATQLTSGENGMMVFDSDLNQFFFWLTDHWEAVGASLQAGDGLEIVNGVINNTGDADASDDFSGNWADLANVPTAFSDDTDDVDDADADPNNELQDLNLSGDILTISGLPSPTQIDLSPYAGNTDEQDLLFSSGQISLSGDPDNTIIDLSAYDADVSDDFSGDWADLQNIPTGFGDGTDDVDDADNDPNNEIELPATAGLGSVLKFNDASQWAPATDLVDDADNDPGNELQDLNLTSNILTITGIGSPTQINLASYTGTNTDEQDLQFLDGQITLTGDPDRTVIDLSLFDSDFRDDFSGSFEDLLDIPFYLDTDVTDDFSGSFLDLDDVPVNLDVNALDDFSGSFLDLTDVPENLDLDATDDFSGSFLDLLDVPVGLDLDTRDDFSGEWGDLLSVPADFSDGSDDVDDADADPGNEIQDLTFDPLLNILSITNNPDATPINLSGLAGGISAIVGAPGDVLKYQAILGWQAGTDEVDDADADPDNELQSLQFEGTAMWLDRDPEGNSIDLSIYNTDELADLSLLADDGQIAKFSRGAWVLANDDNTDNQDLELLDGSLVLTNDDTPVNLNAYFDNTDNQDLELIDGSLVLTNDDTPVNLNAYFDNTDMLAGLPGSNGQVVKHNGITWIAGADEVDDLDNDPNNENQTVTAGTGIGVSQTGQNFQITNTSPDRTVNITGTGNASVSGTYPNFNINVPTSSSEQYAFKAGKSEDQNITSEGKNEIVTFRAESYDLGEVYDVGTSLFTAKASGIYSFSVTIATIADTGADLDINLIVDETQVHSMVISGGPINDSFSFFSDVQLNEGQRVRVEVVSRTSGRIVGKPVQTNWSGRLEMAVSK